MNSIFKIGKTITHYFLSEANVTPFEASSYFTLSK